MKSYRKSFKPALAAWMALLMLGAPCALAQVAMDETFGGTPVGALNGIAYVSGGVLHLTDAAENQTGRWFYNPGQPMPGFHFRCDVLIGGNTSANPDGADGFSFSYSDTALDFGGEVGDASPGLAIRFRTWTFNVLEVVYNDAMIVSVPLSQALIRYNAFVPFEVYVSSQGGIRVLYNNVERVNTTISGWNPQSGWQIALGARTGGSNDNHWIDNAKLHASRPSVYGITRLDSILAGPATSSVRYYATFSDAVTNVSSGDFTVTATSAPAPATPPTASITSVAANPTVNVNETFASGAGVGTLTGSGGGGTVSGGVMHLTDATNGQWGQWLYAPGEAVPAFRAEFDLYIGGGNGADGFIFSYSPETIIAPEGPNSGLTISFDTYDNTTNERTPGAPIPNITFVWNGTDRLLVPWGLRTGSYVPVKIFVTSAGLCTVFHNGVVVGSVLLSGWNPASNWIFQLAGATGGLNDSHLVDNLKIIGSKYLVTLGGLGGLGSIRLDVNSGNDVTDYWGSRSTTYAGGQLYNLDYVKPAITLSGPANSYTNTAVTITAALSESTADFTQTDISLSGCVITAFSGSGSSYSFTLSTSTPGPFSAVVNADKFQDAAGNTNTASNTVQYTFDNVRPSVSLSSSAPNPVNGAISVTATLLEEVNGFISTDITVSNAVVSNFQNSGLNYTFTLTPVTDGLFSANINAGVFTDLAGNQNTAAPAALSRTYDGIKPSVGLTCAANAAVNAPITVNVTTSETTTDFAQGDISTTNASVTAFSGSGMSYTFTLTPAAEGVFSATVPAGVFTDAAANTNTAAPAPVSRTYDISRPSVVLASAAPATVNSAITVTATVNEAVTGFTDTDITVVNASVSGFGNSGNVYTFTLTPQSDGAFSAMINANLFVDAAGNQNTAAPAALSRAYDHTPPTAALSANPANPVKNAISVTVTMNEDVLGFDDTDISVTNALVSGFGVSGSNYVFMLTPVTDGVFSAWIPAGKFTDLVGNSNTQASNTLSRTYDGIRPGVTLACAAGDPVNGSVTVSVTLSESVTTFDAADITRTNATVTGFAGSGLSYSFNLVPTANGPFSAVVEDGVFADAAGNTNTASNTISRNYDGEAPTVELTSSSANLVKGPIIAAVQLSESVTTFNDTMISPANAAVSGFSGSGGNYTFTLTPISNGQFSAVVNGGVFQDSAGNGNIASNTLLRTYDGTVPTIQTRTPAASAIVSSLPSVAITFTEAVTGVDPADVTVNGSPATAISGDNEGPYTFTGFPAPGDGAATVLVASGGIQDMAGNGFAGDTWSYTVDSLLPTVQLASVDVADGGITKDTAFHFTATFSQAVSGLAANEIQVTNAASPVSDFVDNDNVYTFTVIPLADGEVTVRIPQGVAAGDNAPHSPNAASPIFRFMFDHTPPVITLDGGNTVSVDCGAGFVDPGVVSAIDAIDGDLTTFVVVGGDVITEFSAPGGSPYAVTYAVSDEAGNEAEITRLVNVSDNCPLTVLADGDTEVGAVPGAEVTLRVAVTGAIGEAHYVWQADLGAKAFQPLGAPDSPELIITDFGPDDEGLYRCEVSDAVTSELSPVFTLQSEGHAMPVAGFAGMTALIALGGLIGVRGARRNRK